MIGQKYKVKLGAFSGHCIRGGRGKLLIQWVDDYVNHVFSRAQSGGRPLCERGCGRTEERSQLRKETTQKI